MDTLARGLLAGGASDRGRPARAHPRRALRGLGERRSAARSSAAGKSLADLADLALAQGLDPTAALRRPGAAREPREPIPVSARDAGRPWYARPRVPPLPRSLRHHGSDLRAAAAGLRQDLLGESRDQLGLGAGPLLLRSRRIRRPRQRGREDALPDLGLRARAHPGELQGRRHRSRARERHAGGHRVRAALGRALRPLARGPRHGSGLRARRARAQAAAHPRGAGARRPLRAQRAASGPAAPEPYRPGDEPEQRRLPGLHEDAP